MKATIPIILSARAAMFEAYSNFIEFLKQRKEMKYYFFRDLDNESNLEDGKTYHAAGYVELVNSKLDEPSKDGRDLAVCFIEPFEGTFTRAWRSLNNIELFEVDEREYFMLVVNMSKIV